METIKVKSRKRAAADTHSVHVKKHKSVGTDNSNSVASSSSSSDSLANERTIYIEGLPYSAEEAEIIEFFRPIGNSVVESVRLPRWQDSGRLRGYGHVCFKNEKFANKALGLDGFSTNISYYH